MRDGQSVYDHCLTMIKDLEELEKLDMSMDKDLQVDLILQSLTYSYGQFVVNSYINKIQCTIYELVNMLATTEDTLKNLRGYVLVMEQTFSKTKSTRKKKKLTKK